MAYRKEDSVNWRDPEETIKSEEELIDKIVADAVARAERTRIADAALLQEIEASFERAEQEKRQWILSGKATVPLDYDTDEDRLAAMLSDPSLLVNRLGVYDKLMAINDQVWEGRGTVLALHSEQRPKYRYVKTSYRDREGATHYSDSSIQDGTYLASMTGYRLVYGKFVKPKNGIYASQVVVRVIPGIDRLQEVVDCVGELFPTTSRSIRSVPQADRYNCTKREVDRVDLRNRNNPETPDTIVESKLIIALSKSCEIRIRFGYIPSKIDEKLINKLTEPISPNVRERFWDPH